MESDILCCRTNAECWRNRQVYFGRVARNVLRAAKQAEKDIEAGRQGVTKGYVKALEVVARLAARKAGECLTHRIMKHPFTMDDRYME